VVRQRGFTLLEVVFALAIFGMLCAVLFLLTAEMRFYEKRLPINMQKNPQVIAMLARLRRDVQDGHGKNPYLNEYDEYTSSEQVLILNIVTPNSGRQTVVWDFRTPGEVRRRAYQVGIAQDWVNRGLPAEFHVEPVQIADHAAWAARIIAKDEKGRLAIDTILQPRATK